LFITAVIRFIRLAPDGSLERVDDHV